MLNVVCTYPHRYTFDNWLLYFRDVLQQNVNLLFYKEISFRIPAGNYLFTDIDRVMNRPLYKHILPSYVEQIRGRGDCVFNDPFRTLMRYALNKRLAQPFNLYRSTDDYSALRYPVFLRYENQHKQLTDLLQTPAQLETALIRTGPCLICEYIDTADDRGVYHKYSSFLIGDKIIPRHLLFSKFWMVKMPDLETTEMLQREEEYVRTNPHTEAIREIFNTANIDYGRIDYSIRKGQLITWEINTNPLLLPTPSSNNAVRKRLFVESAKAINAALIELGKTKVMNRDRIP